MEVGGSRGTDGKLDLELLNDNLRKNVEGLKYNNNEISEDDSNRITSLPASVNVDEYKIVIEENGKVIVEEASKGVYYPTDKTITVGGKPVAIPGGATVSGIDGEYESVDDGLVIYITNGETITDWSDTETIQKTYDQFVWIPVNKEMAIIEEGKEITGSSNTENIQV